MRWFVLVWLVAGCGKVAEGGGPPCLEPELWFADDDGDGIGDPTRVYFGCFPPQGWVTDSSATDTMDTGSP